MRIIFSKDRPAQLDLLLRSLDKQLAPVEKTTVLYHASDHDYAAGYGAIARERPDLSWWGDDFQRDLEMELTRAGKTVTFLCDDDVLYRPIDRMPQALLAAMPNLLTFSLRLAAVNPVWDWTLLDPVDHGYPGSIDGHVFRTEDVQRMIAGQTIGDPLALETVLAHRVSALAGERPLMACYREQALVGVDVNSVAASGGIRKSGRSFPQPAEELNRRFLAGERISLDALDFSRVDGCLVELPFEWEQAA